MKYIKFIDLEEGEIRLSSGIQKFDLPYGWAFAEEGFPEWQITVVVVGRQDGKDHITVCLTSVDGDTKCYNRLVPDDLAITNINRMIHNATKLRGWTYPMNTVEALRMADRI